MRRSRFVLLFFPRKLGMAQNAHVLSHPSEIRKYAQCFGVSRWRASASRMVCMRDVPNRVSQCATISRSPARPTIMSASTSSDSNSLRYRSARQPVTMTPRHRPFFLYSAASITVAIDSSLAGSMNPQVLTTMMSASSASSERS